MKSKWLLSAVVVLLAVALLVVWTSRTFYGGRSGKPHSAALPHLNPSATNGVTSGKPVPGSLGSVSSSKPTSSPVKQQRVFATADAARQDFLKHAMRLAYRDTPPDAKGHIQRVSLYRTTMKYPLLRVEESLSFGPTGAESILSQQAAVADHIMVGLQPGATEKTLSLLAEQNGGSLVKTPVTGLYLVQFSNADIDTLPHAIQTFSKSKALQYAEADFVVHASVAPNDPQFAGDWGLHNTGQTSGTLNDDIDAEDAWGIVNQSPNVLVAVIDSGIDFNHPDLQANIWTNPNPGQNGYTNDLHGWNFVANNNNPQDDFYHGTHVAGTIGAVGNNGIGLAGVTWKVKLLPLKFLDYTGSGFTSDAINAITYATAVGARIMSNSWGGGGFSQALKDAIDAASTAGDLFVVAAGNDGANSNESLTFPADFSSTNIISVTATDDNDQLASFSNYGTNWVHLAAPGVGILSTLPTVATAAMTQEGLPTSYGQLSGTSMATPHVAGVAALALAQNPSLTMAQLRAQILARVDELPQLAGVVQTAGRLNAYNVVNPNWQGSPGLLQLSSTAFDDTEGDNDGSATPGEIIHFTPTILNPGGESVNGITATITSEQSSATVLTGTLSLGTLLGHQPLTAPSPFRIQLASNLTAGTVLTFDIVLHAPGVSDVHGTATVTIVASRGFAETTNLNFQCGGLQADPVRNLVYATDITNGRIMAISTDSGQLAAVSNTDASLPTGYGTPGTYSMGLMAVSIDDSKLYLALPAAQKIQVFSLPSLTPLTTLPVTFIPNSLACGTGGRLYATTDTQFGNIVEVNATNGQVVQTLADSFDYPIYDPLIYSAYKGTKLFTNYGERRSVGPEGYAEFDISGATASLYQYVGYTPPGGAILGAVDSAANQLLLTSNSGVTVLNILTDDYSTTWPTPDFTALSYAPGNSVIYTASTIYTSEISRLNRTTGAVLNTYTPTAYLLRTNGIAATPNGKALFACSMAPSSGNAIFGLIGGINVTVTNPPTESAGVDLALSSTHFSDREGNGDGVPNSGEIIDLSPVVANLGLQTAIGATISVSGDVDASVIGSASQSVGDVPPGSSVTVASAFRIQLASGLPAGTVVNLTFTLTSTAGTTQSYPYQLVTQPTTINDVAVSTLQYGEIFADQQRNVVYMVDKTDMKLLAFDTSVGHVTNSVPMTGTQAVSWTGQNSGMMAESVDGSILYLAEPQTNAIQKIALPGLTTIATWTYAFQPVSLATDAQGRLYCTTPDATQKLVQINGSTGQVLSQTGPAFSALTAMGNETPTLLRRNAAGTELHASLTTFDQNSDLPTTQIYRYSTTGTGAPVQTSMISIQKFMADFAIDEVNSRYYIATGEDGGVTVLPFSGTGSTLWEPSVAQGVEGAVNIAPGGGVLLGIEDPNSCIDYFSATSGQQVATYPFLSNFSEVNLARRGMATTPNGHTVYVATYLSGDGQTPITVDGSVYEVGMIGGSIDMSLPGPSAISLQSLAITDPAPGSADGFVHPGQTVQLAPIFKNFLNIQATGVTVTLTTTDSLATVNAPATSTVGTVASFATFSPGTNFSVSVSSSATDGHAIPLAFTISYNTGAQQIIPCTLYVTAPSRVEAQANFAVGQMLADPNRDLVYLVDVSDLLVLAINTDTGLISNTVRLASAPGYGGGIALSADGTHLYATLMAAQQIEVISLPDFQQSDLLNLDFQPCRIGAGSDGKLYVSCNTPSNGYLRQVDPVTGKTLNSFGGLTSDAGDLLHMTSDHTILYAAETGISGYGAVYAYTINSTGPPTFLAQYNFDMENLIDFGVDDINHRLYLANGGVPNLEVLSTAGANSANWAYAPNYAIYSVGVCLQPAGNFVYGASSEAIRRFNRVDGTPVADYPVLTSGSSLMDGELAVSANGHVLYAASQFLGGGGVNGYVYHLGLIGGSSLSTVPGTAAPLVYAGADQMVHLSQAASLTATVSSTTNNPVVWTKVSGPGNTTISRTDATSASISFNTPGIYQIQATVTQGSLIGSDLVNITVQPDPPAVSVTAPVATAIPGGTPGDLTFTRTGPTAGAITVNYSVTGSALSGRDFASTLTGTTTIPDGSASTTLPVTALPGATTSTVTAAVAPSVTYAIGVSQAATVKIVAGGSNYATWANTYSLATTAAATPKNDGVPNLLKYVFDINPTQSMTTTDRAALPVVGTDTTTHPGTQYLTLTYRQNSGLASASAVEVQTSTDLKTWSPPQVPTLSQQVGTATNGDPMMEIGMPTNGASTMFIRMSIGQ